MMKYVEMIGEMIPFALFKRAPDTLRDRICQGDFLISIPYIPAQNTQCLKGFCSCCIMLHVATRRKGKGS